ncbi:MAG: aldo/keto reductase [Rhodoferax sp.]|nr:aldo/keto reductase [Rhodoferax sp.]MCF8209845.1 aldo/keto reductase [Rhodoferax sp.]
MQTVRLGSTGLQISRICLGMMTYGNPKWRAWVLDETASRPVVKRAIDLGINFFDTADMYSAGESEILTGKFLKAYCKREEAVVATKVFYPVDMEFSGAQPVSAKPDRRPNMDGLSRKRIFHAVDASLKRLGTDYIDLYQIHRLDPNTPIEETMEALHDLVQAGKVRYLGASSMWAWQFAKAQQVAKENGWHRFVSMQNHYNLAYREEEREMIPLCRDQGVALIPWSPLARGFLAGNRQMADLSQVAKPVEETKPVEDAKPAAEGKSKAAKSASTSSADRARTDAIAQAYYYRPSDFKVVEGLSKLATERGVSNATLAYAWLLHKGVTAPIVGASKPAQLDQAVAALDLRLSSEEIEKLEAAYEPHPVIGHR